MPFKKLFFESKISNISIKKMERICVSKKRLSPKKIKSLNAWMLLSRLIFYNSPISGTTSDCGGIISDIISKNTVDASNTVTDNEIFSPDSGGNRNTKIPVNVMNIEGKAILKR